MPATAKPTPATSGSQTLYLPVRQERSSVQRSRLKDGLLATEALQQSQRHQRDCQVRRSQQKAIQGDLESDVNGTSGGFTVLATSDKERTE